MNHPRDSETFRDHFLPEHVTGDLMLEAAHAFVEIHRAPRRRAGENNVRREWIREHDSAAVARQRIPAPFRFHRAEGSDIGRKIIVPDRLQRFFRLELRCDFADADLPGPALAEDLVDVAAVIRADFRAPGRIADVNVVTVILFPRELVQLFRGDLQDTVALRSKRGVAHLQGHHFPGFERGVIHVAEPRHDAIPVGIERVVERTADDSVAVCIGFDDFLQRTFDVWPDALEKRVVGRHLRFAERAENASGLAIDSVNVAIFRPVSDHSIGLEREAEIDKFAMIPLHFGEESRHRLGVMPDVRAGAGTATDPFMRPETVAR